jgi:hypothetical protein
MVCAFSEHRLALVETCVEGDVICLRVFNQVIVVLCSVSAIKDLLEKRGETYSDRPYLRIAEMYIVLISNEPPY